MIVAGCGCVSLADDVVTPVPDTISTKIVLPVTPVLVEPDIQPPPKPNVEPRVIGTIGLDEWYVVESSVELIVLQSPDGLIGIEAASGPIKVRGKFSDGTGKTETREYRSPYVYFVTAEKTGTTELILVPVGVMDAKDIVRQVLVVSGQGPQPPPVPDPDDPIVPDPVTPAKLQIVIIEDPSESIPPAQVAIRDGQALRDYATTHCTITNGTPDIRKLSIRQDVSAEPEWIKKAFAEPRSKLPFLVVSNGKAGAAVPLPMTLEETMAILKRYGGE